MWKHWELKKQYRERDNLYHNNVHPSRKRYVLGGKIA